MKIINPKMISAAFILIFTLMLGTASAIQPNETVLADDSADKLPAESRLVSKETLTLRTNYFVEESVFHQFIKRGKGHLSLIGQRLRFVFAKYAEVPAELVKALDQLTGGRGPGYLVKIILLFLLLIAIGFGAEKFFNMTILWNDRTRISRLAAKDQDAAKSQSSSSGIKIKRWWFPLACLGLLGFELLWQVNLVLYRKDLVLPLLLTILSIPFGFLLFSIGNRLLLIASGQTELLDPRIVNQDILPKDADISAFVTVEPPPEPVSAIQGDGSSDAKGSLFRRNLSLIRKMIRKPAPCCSAKLNPRVSERWTTPR